MANDPNEKKEFTSILDLQKLQAQNPEPVDLNAPVDPFAVNELQAIEQVDDFQSIDQIGMMDHPEPVEEVAAAPAEDPFAVNTDTQFPVSEPAPAEDPFALHTEPPAFETPTEFQLPVTEEAPVNFSNDISNDLTSSEPELEPVIASPSLSNLKNYSEKSQGKTNLEVKIHYPFHLKINGNFGPFERDKLLLFTTENPIGLSSQDLDMQIQAGKVFLPRISEYAAIKLVQDLRDSGLTFQLHPSDQDAVESSNAGSSSHSFHYENNQSSGKTSTLIDIPILNANSKLEKPFQEIDEVSIVQFVKTEVLEVENSPMIQEVIERMTEALKQKARIKGGNALFSLKQEILPLRLPSQYQIQLKASVIKL
jgi:hypothetical protein